MKSIVAVIMHTLFVNDTQTVYTSPVIVSFGRSTSNEVPLNIVSGVQFIPARLTPCICTGTTELDIFCKRGNLVHCIPYIRVSE